MTNRYFTTKEQFLAFREKWANASGLTAAHHMLYNIIRGRDPEHGFTPFQRLSKMIGQGYLNYGCYGAWFTLKRHQKKAQDERLHKKPLSERVLNRFLAPFGDTFTKEDLANIVIPEVEPIYTTYGPGKEILRRIADGEIAPPRTCVGLNVLVKQMRHKEVA